MEISRAYSEQNIFEAPEEWSMQIIIVEIT